MNNFERLISVVCWFTPGLSLLVLFLWISTPGAVYRHALWSFLSAVAATAALVLVSAVGGLLLGQEGAAVGTGVLIAVSFIYALVVLANAVSAVAGRGPFFAPVVVSGNQRIAGPRRAR